MGGHKDMGGTRGHRGDTETWQRRQRSAGSDWLSLSAQERPLGASWRRHGSPHRALLPQLGPPRTGAPLQPLCVGALRAAARRKARHKGAGAEGSSAGDEWDNGTGTGNRTLRGPSHTALLSTTAVSGCSVLRGGWEELHSPGVFAPGKGLVKLPGQPGVPFFICCREARGPPAAYRAGGPVDLLSPCHGRRSIDNSVTAPFKYWKATVRSPRAFSSPS
ncbi:uncharacterized protein LOC110408269 [Numida meleagris]|uniref:uncharacterized protein LOC110408269 n=1 Tax=Numida meleagris TaxID=8996 RepID=UPI000B3D9E6E|nr:uncharacterized protein LOC110408269 [Numida meleagris]